MDGLPLISVIVPVYNVKEYVETCVNSIISQSYVNLEIILVDDGSTDGSGAICDECAKQCAFIKVLHQPNKGLGAARNAGMGIMSGKYVTFIDSDDIIHREYVATLYKLLKAENADVSTVSLLRFIDEGKIPAMKTDSSSVKIYNSGVDAVKSMLYQQKEIDNSACGKLFIASLFESCKFSEGILYEDLDTIPVALCKAKKVIATTNPLYYYRKRALSILGTFTLKRCDVLDVVDNLEQYADCKCRSILGAAKSRKFSANMNILSLMSVTGVKDDIIEARCWVNIKKLRKLMIIDPKVGLKNKLGAIASYLGLRLLTMVLSLFKK